MEPVIPEKKQNEVWILVNRTFPTVEPTEYDNCYICRWFQSTYCPRNENFIGAHIDNPEDFKGPVVYEICHRFYLTEHARRTRWQKVMDKLHENLEIED